MPVFEETEIGESGIVQDNRMYDGYLPHFRLHTQHIGTLLSHHNAVSLHAHTYNLSCFYYHWF